MDFDEVRRILRGLELPEGGFEDVLAKLDELKGRPPVEYARRYLNRHKPKIERARDDRAA